MDVGVSPQPACRGLCSLRVRPRLAQLQENDGNVLVLLGGGRNPRHRSHSRVNYRRGDRAPCELSSGSLACSCWDLFCPHRLDTAESRHSTSVRPVWNVNLPGKGQSNCELFLCPKIKHFKLGCFPLINEAKNSPALALVLLRSKPFHKCSISGCCPFGLSSCTSPSLEQIQSKKQIMLQRHTRQNSCLEPINIAFLESIHIIACLHLS